jgi:hypothetical protein
MPFLYRLSIAKYASNPGKLPATERGLRPGGFTGGNKVVALSKRISRRMIVFCCWMIGALRLGVRKNVTQSRKARKEDVNPAIDRGFLSLYPERILAPFAAWRERTKRSAPLPSSFPFFLQDSVK